MPPERPVEPVPMRAPGESEPKSQEFPALSPEVETMSAAREACEPAPLPATGESEPFSQESPALSQEVETMSAAREACGAGAPVGRGGK